MGKSEEKQEEQLVAVALGKQSTHLPHYSKGRDYLQFVITNTHTVFGLFCFHRLHPLSYGVRFCALTGSLATSFATYMAIFTFTDALNSEIFDTVTSEVEDFIEFFSGHVITTEQLIVSLIGSPILTVFDQLIWQLAALYCCLPGHILGKYSDLRWLGTVLVVGIVFIMVITSLWLIVVNTAHEGEQGDSLRIMNETIRSGGLTDDLIDFSEALESTFNTEAEKTRDAVIGALIQFGIVMTVTRPLLSTMQFYCRYQKDYDKIEKKLAKIHGGKSKGDSSTDSESEEDYSVTEHSDGDSSDEETGDFSYTSSDEDD